MKNKTFTRLIAMLLAVMFLVSSATVAVGAAGVDASRSTASSKNNLTDKTISDYKETLDTITYADYQSVMNFTGVPILPNGVTLDMTDNWVYVNGNICVSSVGGKWSMIVYGSVYESAAAAIAAGYENRYVTIDGSDSVRVIEETYDSLEEALSVEKNGVAVYKKENLPYVAEYGDKDDLRRALYTPSDGTVTWTLDLKSAGIEHSVLASLAFDYYPVPNKASAIEREFSINGKTPFSEAHSLRFSKAWTSYDQGSTDENRIELVAACAVTKKLSLEDIKKKGDEAGLKYTVTEDGRTVYFKQPEYYTAAISRVIDELGLRFFTSDKNNNELRPAQLQDAAWMSYTISDSDGFRHYFDMTAAINSLKSTINTIKAGVDAKNAAAKKEADKTTMAAELQKDAKLMEKLAEILDAANAKARKDSNKNSLYDRVQAVFTASSVGTLKANYNNKDVLFALLDEVASLIEEDYTSDYFGFVLNPDENGKITLSLKGVNEPMAIASVSLVKYESTKTYAEYHAEIYDAQKLQNAGAGIIKLEAENTVHTSTNVVYPIEDRASALTSPADTTRTLLNTIGTEKWATAGQWAEYSFSVDADGWYDIYARFKQSYLDGMYVNRALTIYTNYGNDVASFKAAHGQSSAGYYNGLPFKEAAELRYNYSTDWQVTKLNSGNNVDYQLYFRKGVVYTVRLEVTLGSMSEMVREIERVLGVLNTAYLDIIKLTGTTPDDYRDYSFYRLLPETLSKMNAEKESLRALSTQLKETAKVASTYTGVCDKLEDLLVRMLQDGGSPIAKNLDTYKSYVGSLGTFLTDAKTQPLQLDYLSIQPNNASKDDAPKATPNFFVAFWHEFTSFIQSFFRDYNSMGAVDTGDASATRVSAWVPYGRDQANVIRNLSTNGFTQDTGIAVDLKLVAGGTLLPSILAGMGPDIYIGLDQGTVINYAIRGALYNIEEIVGIEAFEKDVLMLDKPENERVFNDAAMTVLKIADADGDDHYYGLPENQGFSMMFVRLDVLADLGIEIPKTWDDLYIVQSVLESKNMEIGVSSEYKYFLYQMGGNLWADNGMRINLDSKQGLEAFEKMCAMFTQYSFPYTYDAANRFRTGEMPIIMAGYTGLYNQLKVFATELDGCWTFVPVPGWKHEDGTVNNDSISSVTAIVMISSVKEKSEEVRNAAWEYMRWYSGKDCQADYANEMVAIMGDSAKHSTGNREALMSMPWTTDEYAELIKQFDNLASVENYPGYYFIDRYTNFAFLAAFNNGADPSAELLSYINTINTEITRKRQEFGLETLELGQKLSVKRLGQASTALECLEKNGWAAAYADAIDAAKYGIANANSDKPDLDNIIALEEASKSFNDYLQAKWDKQYKDVTKVNGDVVKKPSYYQNIGKQTMAKDKGGYDINSLGEQELLYFISVTLNDAAQALRSYMG